MKTMSHANRKASKPLDSMSKDKRNRPSETKSVRSGTHQKKLEA